MVSSAIVVEPVMSVFSTEEEKQLKLYLGLLFKERPLPMAHTANLSDLPHQAFVDP